MGKKIKIAIYGRTFHDPHLRGFSRYTANLLDSLFEFLDDFEIYIVSDLPIHPFFNNRYSSKFKIIENHKWPSILWHNFYLPLWLYYNKIDIFHSTINTGLPLLKFGKVQYVATIHDLISYYNFKSKPQRSLMGQLHRLYWDRSFLCDHILTVSNYSKSKIKEVVSPFSKITVIQNSISTFFLKSRDFVDRENRTFFLYVGGFDQRKNIPTLLKAYAEYCLLSVNPLPLKLVGKLSEYEKNEYEEYFTLNKIEFLGYVPDDLLPDLYDHALAVVIPSLEEGFGLQVIESLPSGTPLLSSNCSSLPEVVGDAGIFFNPLDVRELSLQMLSIQEDQALWQKLSKLARNREKNFLPSTTGKQYHQYYLNLCKD